MLPVLFSITSFIPSYWRSNTYSSLVEKCWRLNILDMHLTAGCFLLCFYQLDASSLAGGITGISKTHLAVVHLGFF